MLAHLGDNDLLAMGYTCDKGSGSSRALEALHSLGYNKASLIDYSNGALFSEIKNNRPIYIEGYSYETPHTYTTGWWFWKKSHTDYSYREGHAWVLDGFVRKERIRTIHIYCDYGIESFTQESIDWLELVHNNLGWGGSTNGNFSASGWYHIGIFDTEGSKESSNTYKSGTPYNYQYKNRLITNIY